MYRFNQSFLTIALLCIVTFTTSGCFALLLGAAAGAGGVAYVRGAMEKNLDFSVSEVHAAALKTTKEMSLFVKADELNNHDATISGELDDGKEFKIGITALTERASKVNIRIGVIGDEELSREILTKLQKNL